MTNAIATLKADRAMMTRNFETKRAQLVRREVRAAEDKAEQMIIRACEPSRDVFLWVAPIAAVVAVGSLLTSLFMVSL